MIRVMGAMPPALWVGCSTQQPLPPTPPCPGALPWLHCSAAGLLELWGDRAEPQGSSRGPWGAGVEKGLITALPCLLQTGTHMLPRGSEAPGLHGKKMAKASQWAAKDRSLHEIWLSDGFNQMTLWA